MCVGVLLAFPLVILSSWILTAWLGSGFEDSVVPLALLGVAALFTQTNAVLSQYLFARGRPRAARDGAGRRSPRPISLSPPPCSSSSGEIWVAALATLVVEAIGAMLVLPLLVRRVGVSPRRVFAGWAGPSAAAALPLCRLSCWHEAH